MIVAALHVVTMTSSQLENGNFDHWPVDLKPLKILKPKLHWMITPWTATTLPIFLWKSFQRGLLLVTLRTFPFIFFLLMPTAYLHVQRHVVRIYIQETYIHWPSRTTENELAVVSTTQCERIMTSSHFTCHLQTDRQTDRQTQPSVNGLWPPRILPVTCRQTDRQTQWDRQTDRQTDIVRQTDRHSETDRQTDTVRQTDRQTDTVIQLVDNAMFC